MPSYRLLPATLLIALSLAGCQSLIDQKYQTSLPPESGTRQIQGLMADTSVRRNRLGMPLIEANSLHDAIFTLGYVHASDRISQMTGMRLLADGRLSELAGPATRDLDILMRSLNLRQRARLLMQGASPQVRSRFEIYARGVNAWLYRHQNQLPPDLAGAGYRPAYWQAEDSALIFCLVEFGLAVNLQEEIASLRLAEKVGSERLGWLLPIYPDEPLPHEEAAKLAGLQLDGQIPGLAHLEQSSRTLAELHMQGIAASNNWAFNATRTRSGHSLLANDTHLPISQPSLWNFVHLRTPDHQVAGASVAGIPTVVAGYNGQIAWGMTNAMGDAQDLFLEQVRQRNGRLEYLADGQWLPARTRSETLRIRGESPITIQIHETRHGPLLNTALGERHHALQPLGLSSQYGLALMRPELKEDHSLDGFIELSMATSLDSAGAAVRQIRSIPLNMLYADDRHIAWQVTGRFPNRRQGRGLIPSPGWDSQWDWDGYADALLHPFDQDPPAGWLATANQRTVPPGYGVQVSASWFHPERSERIAELAAARPRHDLRSMQAMQLDQRSTAVGKLQQMLWSPPMASALQQAISQLPPAQQRPALQALARLKGFDGQLDARSADAALYAMFLQQSMLHTFADELGGTDSPAWQALVDAGKVSYSAQADHLYGREDSPFWDDVRTPQREDKPAILARSLASTLQQLEQQLGSDPQQWQWGRLHRYHWQTDGQRLARWMGASQRVALNSLGDYLGHGPVPAGGDHSTLNAAGWHWGAGFDAWLIPAMRMIVDFSAPDPLLAINSSGQSGNPASPHYRDGNQAWLRGEYVSFPFRSERLSASYGQQRLLLQPAGRAR